MRTYAVDIGAVFVRTADVGNKDSVRTIWETILIVYVQIRYLGDFCACANNRFQAVFPRGVSGLGIYIRGYSRYIVFPLPHNLTLYSAGRSTQ